MKVLNVRNVHEALPMGIKHVLHFGVKEDSRNGLVHVFDSPVTTIYRAPMERVLYHPKRDANPFFHLYESLWMLAGRNDVEGVAHYVKRMATFSDDGKRFHGAYGHRWRKHFKFDQLVEIIAALNKNPKDRRTVLQMWDAKVDLGREGKDFPCNTQATFRVNPYGELDMLVNNRSNDMIWGAYGANAVHFSFLQEYVAMSIGLGVGKYWQVSMNFHAYDATLNPLVELATHNDLDNPYILGEVAPMPLLDVNTETPADFNLDLAVYMQKGPIVGHRTRFFRQVVTPMHYAHEAYKAGDFDAAIGNLQQMPDQNDWKRAAIEWINRRQANARRTSK